MSLLEAGMLTLCFLLAPKPLERLLHVHPILDGVLDLLFAGHPTRQTVENVVERVSRDAHGAMRVDEEHVARVNDGRRGVGGERRGVDSDIDVDGAGPRRRLSRCRRAATGEKLQRVSGTTGRPLARCSPAAVPP